MKHVAAGGSRLWALLAPAAFLLDRVTKVWADGLRVGALDVWPSVLRLTYVENTGAAFGLFTGRQALLSIVTGIFLLGLLIFLILKGKQLPALPKAALYLTLGGALGNLYDRVLHGYVIDFIQFLPVSFPVFNVADICVCVGIGLLALWILFGWEAKDTHG